MNNSTAMISVTDLQGRYMLVKHSFERLLHAKSEFLVGKTLYDLLPREHADKIRASDQRVLDGGIVLEVEEVTLRAAQDFVSDSDTRRSRVWRSH
jgi:PAS domain S-box-containing protein